MTLDRLSFAFNDLHFRIEETEARLASGASLVSPGASDAGASTLPLSTSADAMASPVLVVSHTPRLGLTAVAMVEQFSAAMSAPAATLPSRSVVVAAAAAAAAVSEPGVVGSDVPTVLTAPSSGPTDDPTAGLLIAEGSTARVPEWRQGEDSLMATRVRPLLSSLPAPRVRAPHFVAPLMRLNNVPGLAAQAKGAPAVVLCGITKVWCWLVSYNMKKHVFTRAYQVFQRRLHSFVSAACEILQQVMMDPVRAPGGGVYDREALEEYVAEHGKDPSTGAPLAMDDIKAAADVAAAVRMYNFQQLLGIRKL